MNDDEHTCQTQAGIKRFAFWPTWNLQFPDAIPRIFNPQKRILTTPASCNDEQSRLLAVSRQGLTQLNAGKKAQCYLIGRNF